MDIEQSDDGVLRELALFAGAGGGILGGKLLGWRTVCAVEREAYPAQVLAQRQNDGILEPFPIWSDVCSFDGRPWRGIVDIISGGFPCQDISTAGGPNRKGLQGGRSGLWREFARIICEVEPRYIFVENSPALTFRGLDVVLGDLAEMGFDAAWGVFSAGDIGARHQRERIWIVASNRDATQNATLAERCIHGKCQESIRDMQRAEWSAETIMGRAFDAMAFDVDRLAAIGNGQVPSVAATAFQLLLERLTNAR